ncbi:alpha/beta fold hydrolase [Nocardioides baekrokdamisoli]|uniref:alpha/beta fold hydrolase n=1 Tax=Nocardioides baekrokdamisoli TaxID=1804624 RepID=UPI0013DDEEC6|nr:alpha/beta hydrolase [Nocardioides baekrokdamisoli]
MVLAYEVHGTGEPIVLIHGVGHRRQAWDPIVPLLANDFQVITIDLPGFGESGPLVMKKGHAEDALRKELIETVAFLGIENPHVVGNSLGGLIALEIAHDGRAKSATALSPAGFWDGEADFTYINLLFNSVLTAATFARPIARPLLSTALGRKVLLSWLNTHAENIPPEVAYGDFKALAAAAPNVRRLLAEHYQFEGDIDVPATVAWSEKDRVLLPYQARRAARLLPNAQHITLAGVGHVPMWDDPELVAETIRDTVARASAPARKKKVARA